ncbi:alpha/beta fold hydrolase [Microvirga alba]|uniref:Alpha/beta hydrolase n=1 Tax=Microvirga alba TaxID=2791025 RepID=A0A931BLH7_9HYPH|nr:alpha/beta hydrolase [Microvirga alba]MBF9233247.1 alpha/beta hydrolase [Microvirga alba]
MSTLGATKDVVARGTVRSGIFTLGYSIEGEGKPALVIGSSVYYPRTFSAGLRKTLKLVFVDHRGFAHSSKNVAKSEYDLDIVLDDIERIRGHLGLTDMVIIGHSGHGYMALEYAKRYSRHVSHVVLIGTGPSHSPAHAAMTEQHWQEAVCPERKARLESDLQSLPAEIAASPETRFVTYCVRMGARSWYDHTFDASALWSGVHVNMDMFDTLWGEVFRDIDVTKGLDDLDIPVFIALGRFDYLVAPYHAWEPYRQSFRDLTVRVFDRSGHTPQLEESAAFDAELLRWIAAR